MGEAFAIRYDCPHCTKQVFPGTERCPHCCKSIEKLIEVKIFLGNYKEGKSFWEIIRRENSGNTGS